MKLWDSLDGGGQLRVKFFSGQQRVAPLTAALAGKQRAAPEPHTFFSFLQITGSSPPRASSSRPQKQLKTAVGSAGAGGVAVGGGRRERGSFALAAIELIFLRYNMVRLEGGSSEAEEEEARWEARSSGEESSPEGAAEDLSADEVKIEELQSSVERLREFVRGLPAGSASSVPASVEEYCDKMEHYRVHDADYVVQIAQRRVNKMLRNRKIKRNWNNEDITLLVWLVSKQLERQALPHHSQLERQDWQLIAALIAGSTPQKCKFRWLGLKKVKLVAHKWSKLESKLLSEAVVRDQKTNWKAVSERLYESNANKNKVFRTAKQCREHWNCFLNPAIQKGPWTLQEDRRLLEYVLELEGSKKWSEIAKFMEGRTENALKNRFNLLIGRQRKASGHLTEKRLVKTCLSSLILEEGQLEHLEPPSAISAAPVEREPAQGSTAEGQENREPAVFAAQNQSSAFASCSGFQTVGYQGMVGYVGGFGSGVAPHGQNTVYIGFLFPTPFM